ncbi:MAG: aspartate dehydrogenase [Methanobrevibacter sp.]|jgi:aspartate dehydrogenase|nr:aspartate dehydrogenase [Methanobrevibacter sp.]
MIVGILGCGSIANILINELKYDEDINLKYFYDNDIEQSKKLARIADGIATDNFELMVDKSDLIIEAASPRAVGLFIGNALKKGKNVVIMSVGYLMDVNNRKNLERIAKENNARIYLPSGAIVGLDGLKAASIGKIESVTLTTRKSPKSIDSNEKKEIIFDGKASEAVKIFPTNINVAAALSIASNMDINVKIIIDPEINRNIHEVHVKGEFGSFTSKTENVPSKINPKTSVLAAYSAVNLLKSLNKTIHI